MTKNKTSKNDNIAYYEIRRSIKKYILELKQSELINIDYIVSDILCYIKSIQELNTIFDDKVEKYEKLRDKVHYQRVCINLINTIIEAYNTLGWEMTPHYISPMFQNTNRDYTLLYFWNLHEIQDKPTRNDLNIYGMPLIQRNLYIFLNKYNKLKEKTEKPSIGYLADSIHQVLYTIEDLSLYNFHFFNIESHQAKVWCYEQTKIAGVQVLESLDEEIRTCLSTDEKDDYTAVDKELELMDKIKKTCPKFDLLPPKQKEIFLYIFKGKTANVITSKNHYSRTTVYRMAANICETLELDKKGFKELENYIAELKLQLLNFV